MNPEFTIITVSYNSETTIERTIKSVLNQTFKDFEYIIVDGRSNDNTCDIVERYRPQFNGKLRSISEPDFGVYDAMNKGIDMAKGRMIALLNSDDHYFPHTLETVYSAFKNHDNSVITGELIFKGANGDQLLRTSKKRFTKKIETYKNGVRHPATFVPKSIYDKVGLFDLNYKIASDAELMFRIFKNDFQFIFINEPLVVMYDGGISNSKGLFKQLLSENYRFLKTYCKNPFLRIYYLTLTVLRLGAKELLSKLISNYRKIENH